MDRGTPQETVQPTESSGRGMKVAEAASTTRRSFLGVLIGVGTVGVGALLSAPLVRFALYPAFARTTETKWSDIGAIQDFASMTAPVARVITIEQLDGWRKNTSEKPVYVARAADGQLKVLSAVCPHLGCTITWNESKKEFLSPCHNGVFTADGALVSGPPRRAMDELESKVEDGRLKVRYQYFRPLVAAKEAIA